MKQDDYRSRCQGCVSTMLAGLKLPSLKSHRHDGQLQFIYRAVEVSVLAIPPEHFLQPERPNDMSIQSIFLTVWHTMSWTDPQLTTLGAS